MMHEIRETVTVRAGGRIEIYAPQLAEGSCAEVIVIPNAATALRPLSELIGRGRGAFLSPADVDAFLRREREEWS
jgi:hypothetical protein